MVAHDRWAESETLYQPNPRNTSTWSQQSTTGKGCGSAVTDYQVIQKPDIDQFEGRFEAFCNALIGLAGLGDPARMVVRENNGGCVNAECLFNDLARVDYSTSKFEKMD